MSTKKYAVIGHPIGHTMSPFIHTKLFELAGIDAVYTKLDVAPESLGYEYDHILSKLSGYNITIPHKQKIIQYLDESIQFDQEGYDKLISKLSGYNEKLYTDVMTGIYNRRYFEEKI